jgi:hypothetical protein
MATLAETRAVGILAGLGVRSPSPVSVSLLVAWQKCEGGPASRHNPLNTTLRMPGSRSINPEGVQEYPSEAAGIAATVATLTNGRYTTLVRALRTGDPGLFFGAAGRAEIATWGTDVGCIQRVYQGPSSTPQASQPRAWVVAVAIGTPLLALILSR